MFGSQELAVAIQGALAVGGGAASGRWADRLLGHYHVPVQMRLASPVRIGLLMVAGAIVGGAVLALAGRTWALPAHVVLGMVTVPLAAVDIAVQRLPTRVIGPASAAAVVLLGVAAAVSGTPVRLGQAVLASAALMTAFTIIGLVGQLGMGDVRLIGLLGLYLGWDGWYAVLLGPVLGFAGAAAVTAILLIARRASWSAPIPLGPYLLAGTYLALAIA